MSKRVLIVEDDPDFATSLELAMDLAGMQTCKAQSAEEAYTLFESEGADIGLGFFDIKLPGENGIACIQKLRRKNPDLICVVMTGFRDEDLVKQATDAGAVSVLMKPFRMAELMELASAYCR